MKFEAVIGIQSGYGINPIEDPVKLVAMAWKEICEKEYKSSGISISAIVSLCRAVYPGPCPLDGEICASLFGNFEIPENIGKSPQEWRRAIEEGCGELLLKFEQEIIILTIIEIEKVTTIYITKKEETNE